MGEQFYEAADLTRYMQMVARLQAECDEARLKRGEVEAERAELQAYVGKFEAHLNDLELELYDTARERDEARQRAERAERERDQLRRHAAAVEAAIRSLAALKERVMEIEIGEFYRVAWNSMPTADALAADQPAEADGEG